MSLYVASGARKRNTKQFLKIKKKARYADKGDKN